MSVRMKPGDSCLSFQGRSAGLSRLAHDSVAIFSCAVAFYFLLAYFSTQSFEVSKTVKRQWMNLLSTDKLIAAFAAANPPAHFQMPERVCSLPHPQAS